uniref:Uncharacterized protein n=1 Tax=Lutzomyia longipalpis TaxID=7200 RepID=A0A1B0GIM1_LUTLO
MDTPCRNIHHLRYGCIGESLKGIPNGSCEHCQTYFRLRCPKFLRTLLHALPLHNFRPRDHLPPTNGSRLNAMSILPTATSHQTLKETLWGIHNEPQCFENFPQSCKNKRNEFKEEANDGIWVATVPQEEATPYCHAFAYNGKGNNHNCLPKKPEESPYCPPGDCNGINGIQHAISNYFP